MVPVSLSPNFPQLALGILGCQDVSPNNDLAELTRENPQVLHMEGEVVMDPDLHITDLPRELPPSAISHHIVATIGLNPKLQVFSSFLSNATKVTASISHGPNYIII